MTEPILSIPVQEYVDREIARTVEHERALLAEQLRFVGQQFVTLEQARSVAAEVVELRLESMNKFREEAEKDAETYIRRDIHERDIGRIEDKVTINTRSQDRQGGTTDLARWIVPTLPSLIAAGLALYAILSK